MWQRLKYRAAYWRRVFWNFWGRCPKCHGPVNYTRSGRPICPWCA